MHRVIDGRDASGIAVLAGFAVVVVPSGSSGSVLDSTVGTVIEMALVGGIVRLLFSVDVNSDGSVVVSISLAVISTVVVSNRSEMQVSTSSFFGDIGRYGAQYVVPFAKVWTAIVQYRPQLGSVGSWFSQEPLDDGHGTLEHGEAFGLADSVTLEQAHTGIITAVP